MNRLINLSIAAIILSYLVITFTWVEAVYAKSVHKQIRPSLVYLKATAKGASGAATGVEQNSYATGFLVSEGGLVLTVYHLISELGDIVPQTVSIEARIGEKHSEPRDAMIVEGMRNTDLLLLKIPPRPEKYTKVTLGSALNHKDENPVYTSGFPKGLNYRKHEDKIEARDAPGGYLWTTGLKFEQGQSGSPIYNATGEIIGVVKGQNKDGTLSYMIPIEFADSLIAQVRFAEIKKALQGFESLRRKMNWSGELLKKGRVDPKIVIKYEKMVSGNPHVKKIELWIKPIGLRDGEEEYINGFSYVSEERSNEVLRSMAVRDWGTFELNGLWEKVENLRRTLGFSEIKYLKVAISSILSNGTQLPSKSIVIDYEQESNP